MKFAMIDLHPLLNDNREITVSVGEATNSMCSGNVTLVILDVNGQTVTQQKTVTSLSMSMQLISFNAPTTGKIHPVVANLTLDSGETKTDKEAISL